MWTSSTRASYCLALALLAAAPCALAAPSPVEAASAPQTSWAPESGKLLATAGVTELEGAGGGGLVPWVLIQSGVYFSLQAGF